MAVKISTKQLADIIVRYMGGSDRSVYSYDELNRVIMHRRGVTVSEMELAITQMDADNNAIERTGAGDNGSQLGQVLTAKGRRMAKQLRSGK